jgi:hypothetical protein
MSGNVPASGERDLFRIVRGIRDLFEGRSNAVGSFTLTANAATTIVTAPNCGAGCTISVQPTTANAAAEIGNGTMYIGTVSAGAFVVTHANNAQTDRTFRYAAFG